MEPFLSGNFIRNQNLILNSLMPALMPEALACFSKQRNNKTTLLVGAINAAQIPTKHDS